jgi:parvulin-like peptidyl-prolyl isomerase
MKRHSLIFFITLFCTASLFAQKSESVVAKIGNEKITAEDFQLRIELSPYIPDNKRIDRLNDREFKNDFLYSLVAEKLWSAEAERLGFASSEKFNFHFKPLEDLFIRDALFKQEIEGRVKLSAGDISLGIQKKQIKLVTQIISSNDSVGIHNFTSALKLTNNFDSLLARYPEFSSVEKEISLGSLKDEEIEDSLYALNINQVTFPINSDAGWILFRIKNKIITPINLNDQKSIEDMKKIIRNRRIENNYNNFMQDLLGYVKIVINSESFYITFTEVWNRLKKHTSVSDSNAFFSLSEADYYFILKSLNDSSLNKPLFNIDKKEITINNFLSDLAFHGFTVNQLDSNFVMQKLNQRLKKFVEYQILTLEGLKRELHLNPEVRKDLILWKQNYLAQFYSNSVLDSISVVDDELYSHYVDKIINDSNLVYINVRIITLDNLDEVSNIFDQLKEGLSFSEIIKKYGKTDSLVNSYGETGLKPVVTLGEIGRIASGLKLDAIYGPIQRNNSYSIFQVIDKKGSTDSLKLSFESIKNELKSDLRLSKLIEKLKTNTSKLAEKYNLKIYSDVLEKVQISQIPMFIHRFMGFGGRIDGRPLVTPFSEWMDEISKKNALP